MRYSHRSRALLITAPALLALGACAGPGEGEPGGTSPTPITSPTEESTAPPPPPADEPTDDATDTSPDGGDEVDPADFARGSDYVFASPTDNLACGISAEEQNAFHAGCHAWSVVENLPECDDPETNGPWVAIHQEDGQARTGCQHEGVYADPDATTLEYGQSLTAHGVTCTSAEDGVTCTRGEESFFASREAFEPAAPGNG